MMVATDSDNALDTKIQAAEEADDWADLDLGSPENHTVVPSRHKLASSGRVDTEPDLIPDLATIPRPEDLTRKPPYWIMVRQEGRQKSRYSRKPCSEFGLPGRIFEALVSRRSRQK